MCVTPASGFSDEGEAGERWFHVRCHYDRERDQHAGRSSDCVTSRSCDGSGTGSTASTPSRWTSRRWPAVCTCRRATSAVSSSWPTANRRTAYLMTRRIERAMALLRRGDLSVTEVCFTVGCSSLGTFTTRFTELVGVPPGVYRQQQLDAAGGIPSCVEKQVTRPIRNREGRAGKPALA